MRQLLKVMLILGGAFFLLCVLLAGAGAWWFKSNEARFKGAAESARAAGATFGGAHTDTECRTKALEELHASNSFLEQVGHSVFLESCLKAATVTPALCAKVPRKSEIGKGILWAVAECADRPENERQACSRLMQKVIDVCDARGLESP